MTVYQQINWVSDTKTHLTAKDTLKHVPGGVELVFASSPATTTFYPYHKIHSIETIDTSKAIKPKLTEDGYYGSYDSLL